MEEIMALSVINNISALTAKSNLQGATNAQSTSIQRLSTGLRINKASDDASGLAISEKMRTQIRGLNKANENAQNGISMLQTAEGALNETHSILQRMRELAVQASNGTLTSNDRTEVQKEVDALKDEIDGISTRTEFNTKKLLTGDASGFASASTDKLEAVFNGGKVQNGEYQLEIDAKAGTNQVQASSIFRVKEGVQSVDNQDLNASAAEHKLSLNLGAGGNGDTTTLNLKFTVDGVDYTVNSVADEDDLATSMTNLQTAFLAVGGAGLDAGLASKMDLTISGETAIFTMKDASKDFTLEIDETAVAGNTAAITNLDADQKGTFDVQARSSETGVAEFTNLNNLAPSPNADASYNLIVDKKGDGSMVLDRLETVSGQDVATTYADDIYHIMGSNLQAGSTGFTEAKLDLDLTIEAAGTLNIDFNLDGDPNNTINFISAIATFDAAGLEGFATAFNADNRLNGSIRAEADGLDLKFYALDEKKALDYKVQLDASKSGNATVFATPMSVGTEIFDAQFVTGMGKLGVSQAATTTDAAFTTASNSHHGTEALIEFTTDGTIGQAGLDARVSFDGGDNWTYVEDIWDGGTTDKIATDGYYSLNFNALFTNDGQPGNFQAGDSVLIAMNDNANAAPADTATIKYNDYNTGTIVDGNGKSTVSMNIDVAGETFKFDIDLDTTGTLDENDAGSQFVDQFNAQVGSNGTALSSVMGIEWDGTNIKFSALTDDFTLEMDEGGAVSNIGAGETAGTAVTRRFQDTEGDLTRIDSFDPTSGSYQMGVVTSHINGALNESITTLSVASMDESNGQVNIGSVDARFSLGETGTLPTDGSASFTATENGGGDVQASTKLMDLDRFYNADGQFVLGENGETFSIYNANGDKADVYIDGGDSLTDVTDKLRSAITKSVSDGGLGMSTGSSELDQNIVSLVSATTPGSVESQQGSIVIKSSVSGADGRIFVSGSEDLKTALGLSEVQSATENELSVTVKDSLSGNIVGGDKVTDNTLHGVISGVDVEFDQSIDIKTSYNEKTKNFEFSSSDGKVSETLKIVDNSTDFQIGANEGQTLNVNVMRSDSHSLKVDKVQVTDEASAMNAISQVDDAINKVSSERAKIGAWVNRLEHTMANLDVQSENQTAAESRIRDLNIASETTQLSKSQILSQASTSMLAQANQQGQSLLALLR
jgi:flagellin